jgi:CBS domain-containing protein
MRAKDIMTTPVITVRLDTPIKVAAALLVDHEVSALPVIDEHDELVGIVSEADLITLETNPDPRSSILHVLHREQPTPRTVAEVMTRDVVTLPEDVDAAHVARLMLEKRIKSIPIVSGQRPWGSCPGGTF